MTITGPRATQCMAPDLARTICAVAVRPAPVSDVRVVDDEGQTLPDGEVGEVITRSDCVMEGYWNNPEATAAALRDGWLYTGDVGSMDRRGFLTLRDRIERHDHFRRQQHLSPRNRGSSLCGIRTSSRHRLSGSPILNGARKSSPSWWRGRGPCLNSQDLDQLCLSNIARFKRPKHYRFLENLPKNAYGKILKTELRHHA